MTLDEILADGAPPIAAILRGIKPDEATDVGVGGSVYRPGDTAAAAGERARALVAAWRETRA